MKVNSKPTGAHLPTTDAASTSRLNKANAKGADALLSTKSQKSSGVANSTKVDVSERAQQIKKAKELASKDLDKVDEAKVARLQKLIDEGKYKVDSEALADRLVDEHLNMPS